MNKRTTLLLLCLALAAAGAAAVRFGWIGGDGGSGSVDLTRVQPVQRDVVIDLVENGVLEAESATHISAPNFNAERKLIEVVPEGAIVKKGDVIARFDTAQLEDRLEAFERSGLRAQRKDIEMESEIKIADLEAAHQTAVENAKLAELTLKGMTYAAKLDRDAAEARHNNARNEIKVAANRIRQEENRRDVKLRQSDELIAENERKIEETRKAIADFTISAPEDGIVVYPLVKISGLERKVQTGDQLYKSQVFLIIPNLFKMTAQVEVAEEDIRRVRVGQAADIVLEAYKDAAFTGEVYQVAPLAHVKQNNEFIKAFTVGVRIRERDLERLRPGMNARVTIRLAGHSDAWTVPVSCVLLDGDGGHFVWLAGGDGTATRHAVTLVDSGRDVAVLAERPPGAVAVPDAAFREWSEAAAGQRAKARWRDTPGAGS